MPDGVQIGTKGQLISKCLFYVFNSPKKTNEKIWLYCQYHLFTFFGKIWRHEKDISKLTDLYFSILIIMQMCFHKIFLKISHFKFYKILWKHECKVQIFWECHKCLKKISVLFWHYSVNFIYSAKLRPETFTKSPLQICPM